MKKKLIILFLGILLYLFIILTVFVWYNFFYKSTKTNNIIINDFHNAVYKQDMSPVTDEEGKKLPAYEFVIENISPYKQSYEVYLNEIFDNQNKDILSKEYLKYQLIKNGQEIEVDYLININNGLLDRDVLKARMKNVYSVRLWIDEKTADENWSNKSFNYQFSVKEIKNDK